MDIRKMDLNLLLAFDALMPKIKTVRLPVETPRFEIKQFWRLR